MENRKIGIWMYQNGGGDVIQEKLKKKLIERDMTPYSGLNLYHAYADSLGLFCNQIQMDELDLFFSYNAGEQTVYQMYLYEALSRFIPTINNYSAFALTEDKFKTLNVLRKAGIPTTEFVLCHRDDKERVHRIFEFWDHKLIYKPVDGWGGVGMVKIEGEQALDFVLPFMSKTDLRFFYLERFIPNDGSDFRVDVVDGQFISCYGRKAGRGEWRTNVTSGGKVIIREANDQLVSLAIKAAKATGLEVAGVDLLYDLEREEYVVMEVNGIPAFATPDQEAMGLDFNNKKIDALVELIDRRSREGIR
ncbi:MAG: ATP-grasp domain-containing protein [Magnetococcales bacterium]|nr:ATP-grasp domain-containing protein [Magnetococcales bacterium]